MPLWWPYFWTDLKKMLQRHLVKIAQRRDFLLCFCCSSIKRGRFWSRDFLKTWKTNQTSKFEWSVLISPSHRFSNFENRFRIMAARVTWIVDELMLADPVCYLDFPFSVACNTYPPDYVYVGAVGDWIYLEKTSTDDITGATLGCFSIGGNLAMPKTEAEFNVVRTVPG